MRVIYKEKKNVSDGIPGKNQLHRLAYLKPAAVV